LALGEEMDWEGILSTLPGAPAVTRSSPTAVLRKQYYKLSALVHPDKLERRFKQATKTFQLLVTAYERLSQPELYAEEDKKVKKGEKKQAKLARSNEGW
jgi:curved DNA-binding protein CbpA